MKCSSQCLLCFLKKQEQFLAKQLFSDACKRDYLCAVMRMLSEYAPQESAPRLMARMNILQKELLGVTEDLTVEKQLFNELMLRREPLFRREIEAADDPLAAALRLSRTGNYIDFSAVENVTGEKLAELLARSRTSPLDEATLAIFRADLAGAEKLVFCTDNCGEIVLDKLLIETLQKLYPSLKITVIVRGGAVINDAAMEDAGQIGLCEIVPVIGSGAPIPGTDIDSLDIEARTVFDAADLIIAKGQGNFESLSGCGRNIYYLFLCKCDLFVQRFGLRQFEGVFTREKALFPENNA